MTTMKKKFVNILNMIEVMERLMKGFSVEGALYIDKETHQLAFKPYNRTSRQLGYNKRPKPVLIKKLPWGWLKQSTRNNILRLSVPKDMGATQTMSIFNQNVREANDALFEQELIEFC